MFCKALASPTLKGLSKTKCDTKQDKESEQINRNSSVIRMTLWTKTLQIQTKTIPGSNCSDL